MQLNRNCNLLWWLRDAIQGKVWKAQRNVIMIPNSFRRINLENFLLWRLGAGVGSRNRNEVKIKKNNNLKERERQVSWFELAGSCRTDAGAGGRVRRRENHLEREQQEFRVTLDIQKEKRETTTTRRRWWQQQVEEEEEGGRTAVGNDRGRWRGSNATAIARRRCWM